MKLHKSYHELYEIWNEYTAESVFFSGNPTKEQLLEVVEKEWWPLREFGVRRSTPEEYIKKWVRVEPLKRVYAPRFS